MDAKERVRMKRNCTDSDRHLLAMGLDIVKRKRNALIANPSFVLYVDDPNIIRLDLFQNLDVVLVLEWDVESGVIMRYPLLDWVADERYRTRSLVITRDSDKGKTQVAKSLLAHIAAEKQGDLYPRPHMIVVQTVEGLANAASGGWCKEWVCILLDEVVQLHTCIHILCFYLHVPPLDN